MHDDEPCRTRGSSNRTIFGCMFSAIDQDEIAAALRSSTDGFTFRLPRTSKSELVEQDRFCETFCTTRWIASMPLTS